MPGTQLGGPSSSRVTMSTMLSFATTWLVPRLARFAQRYPDIEIAVETGTRPVDLRREPIDLAIRHGLGKYPGFEATWLVAPELIVVASPDLLKNRAPLPPGAIERGKIQALHPVRVRFSQIWASSQTLTAVAGPRPQFCCDRRA